MIDGFHCSPPAVTGPPPDLNYGLSLIHIYKLEQARLRYNAARANSTTARDTFNNWLATRQATRRADQDPELIARTQELDDLKAAERKALSEVEAHQQVLLDAQQAEARTQAQLRELERVAADRLSTELRSQELRVFLYRLTLTLPLLAIAGWLFAKKRNSTWWPFVWGFIYFAPVSYTHLDVYKRQALYRFALFRSRCRNRERSISCQSERVLDRR